MQKNQQDLFDEYKCSVCCEYYSISDHIPYVLHCGHNVCLTAIHQLYNKITKKIKCPECRTELCYESVNNIKKNFSHIKVLEKLLQNKNESIQQLEQELDRIDVTVQNIRKQNKVISDYVEALIQKRDKVLKFNRKRIDQLKVYQLKQKTKMYPKSFSGLKKKEHQKIKKEVHLLTQKPYISYENFQQSNEIYFEEIESCLKYVESLKVLKKYTAFKENMLNYIDQTKWSQQCKISNDNWREVLNLLNINSKNNVEDSAILSFIHWKGIGVQKDEGLAKQLISSKLCDSNGRALYIRYRIFGRTQPDDLVQSCLQNYGKAISLAAYDIEKLTNAQKKIIYHSLSAKLGSARGISNLGTCFYQGDGVKVDRLKGANLVQKAIEEGYLSGNKKVLDKFHDESQVFRNQNPNYKKWQGNYEDFKRQEIVIL